MYTSCSVGKACWLQLLFSVCNAGFIRRWDWSRGSLFDITGLYIPPQNKSMSIFLLHFYTSIQNKTSPLFVYDAAIRNKKDHVKIRLRDRCSR